MKLISFYWLNTIFSTFCSKKRAFFFKCSNKNSRTLIFSKKKKKDCCSVEFTKEKHLCVQEKSTKVNIQFYKLGLFHLFMQFQVFCFKFCINFLIVAWTFFRAKSAENCLQQNNERFSRKHLCISRKSLKQMENSFLQFSIKI